MTRALYRMLLWLHPPAFRRQFAAEMLLTFSDAAPETGSLALLCDAFVSLLRQWFFRSGFWKAVVALVCAALQVAPGLWMGRLPRSRRILSTPGAPIQMDGLVAITGVTIAFVVFMVAASVFWAAHVSRIRTSAKRRLA